MIGAGTFEAYNYGSLDDEEYSQVEEGVAGASAASGDYNQGILAGFYGGVMLQEGLGSKDAGKCSHNA